jgi:Fur family transcriptional regulator, ferric uptake regulator
VELVPAHKHYELNTDSKYHHHHIVCVQCNQAIEFINQSIIQQGRRQVQKAGLELLDCRFTLHAICPEAIENGWPTLVPSHWVCSRVKANTSHGSYSYNPTDTPIEERE